MNTNPGWVEENLLAESLGWLPRKDLNRSRSPEQDWSQFYKLDERVWLNPGMRWTRALYRDGQYTRQRFYKTLKGALVGDEEAE